MTPDRYDSIRDLPSSARFYITHSLINEREVYYDISNHFGLFGEPLKGATEAIADFISEIPDIPGRLSNRRDRVTFWSVQRELGFVLEKSLIDAAESEDLLKDLLESSLSTWEVDSKLASFLNAMNYSLDTYVSEQRLTPFFEHEFRTTRNNTRMEETARLCLYYDSINPAKRFVIATMRHNDRPGSSPTNELYEIENDQTVSKAAARAFTEMLSELITLSTPDSAKSLLKSLDKGMQRLLLDNKEHLNPGFSGRGDHWSIAFLEKTLLSGRSGKPERHSDHALGI